jgi:hypothetical protein
MHASCSLYQEMPRSGNLQPQKNETNVIAGKQRLRSFALEP